MKRDADPKTAHRRQTCIKHPPPGACDLADPAGPAVVLPRIKAVVSERSPIQAMHDVGYFPASNPPDAVLTLLPP